MLRRLSLSTLNSFRTPDHQEYSDALTAISLDMEETCREPELDAFETVYEVPTGICPVRLASKAKRRLSKSDISRGLRVDVGYCLIRNAVVCKVSDPRSPTSV
ncbi:hypothetical protein BDK51DRAFT_31533 [Blyttiomyces helicus]|uniref:Uncharacterized protein n=1 Tax=Blyttiomyces helicus TaxID=388810 RepID=A0A4P9VW98_9FUNG|nr:hypothetical protein BDK51DRAFT_31533 [Blyttiomyces helicus]|eukprot:RKO83961.1 hypothetical protein BDK51DRAFT_31533 [Blyttiomyces helicus]